MADEFAEFGGRAEDEDEFAEFGGEAEPEQESPGLLDRLLSTQASANQNDPKLRSVNEQAAAGTLDVPGKTRDAIGMGAALATTPFTGGLGLAARMGAAGLASAAGSLAAEPIDPSGSAGEAARRAAETGVAGAVGEGLGSAAVPLVRGAAQLGRRGAAAVGGALDSAGAAAEPYLREKGGQLMARAAGIYGRTGVRKAGGAEGVADLGNRLYDEGIVTPGVSVAKAGERADALKATAGPQIGGLIDDAQRYGSGPQAESIVAEMENLAAPYRKFDNLFAKQITNIVDQYASDIAKNTDAAGAVPPKVLGQLKRQLDAQLQSLYNAAGGKPIAPLEEARLGIRQILSRGEESAVGSLPQEGTAAVDAFKRVKQQYGDAKTVSAAADYAEEGNLGNLPIGLTDTIVGSSAGLVPLAAKKLANRYGSSVAGVGARKLADAIANRASVRGATGASGDAAEVIPILDRARSQGTQALRAAAVVLATRYPELKEAIFEEVQAAPE